MVNEPALKAQSVSVVVPSYNSGRWVAEAVASALAQRYPAPLEVIVVDDGSADDTAAVLAPFGERIRYLRQENRGVAAARNVGVRAATSEWVAFLDADDVWHPDKTALQLTAAADRFVLLGSPKQSAPLPAALPGDPAVRPLTVRDLLTWTPICPSATMVRRRALLAVGLFDEALQAAEDRDLWLRLAARFPAARIESPCVFYRLHAEQMNHQTGRMLSSYRQAVVKFFRDYPEHRALEGLAWAALYLDAGVCHMEAGQRREAAALLVRSLRAWPRYFEVPNVASTFMRPKLLLRVALGEERFGRLLRLVGGAPGGRS